jgi:hypothetical protein
VLSRSSQTFFFFFFFSAFFVGFIADEGRRAKRPPGGPFRMNIHSTSSADE